MLISPPLGYCDRDPLEQGSTEAILLLLHLVKDGLDQHKAVSLSSRFVYIENHRGFINIKIYCRRPNGFKNTGCFNKITSSIASVWGDFVSEEELFSFHQNSMEIIYQR